MDNIKLIDIQQITGRKYVVYTLEKKALSLWHQTHFPLLSPSMKRNG